MAQKIPGAPSPEPWKPPYYNKADAGAVQAMFRGEASPEQMRRGMSFIVRNLCGYHDLSFRPDQFGGERATCFAEGKRFVGTEIVKLNEIDLSKLKDDHV